MQRRQALHEVPVDALHGTVGMGQGGLQGRGGIARVDDQLADFLASARDAAAGLFEVFQRLRDAADVVLRRGGAVLAQEIVAPDADDDQGRLRAAKAKAIPPIPSVPRMAFKSIPALLSAVTTPIIQMK